MTVHRIEFEVPGEPVPKGRPRADGRGARPRIYTPPETVKFERRVGELATAARVEWTTRAGGVLWPMRASSYYVLANVFVGRRDPDADNVFKSIADGMIGALYADDKRCGGFFPPPMVDARPRVDVVVLAFESDAWVSRDDRHVLRETVSTLCARLLRPSSTGTKDRTIDELCELLRGWR